MCTQKQNQNKKEGTVLLETDRLILRRFKIDDAKFMFKNWASDPEVTKYVTWFPHKDLDETISIVSHWIEEYETPERYQWAIVLKSVNEPIGSIGVVRHDKESNSAEMGYCIGKKFWHQGYTSEALSEVLKYLFCNTELNRIAAKHDIRNPNSGRVMKKCGMKYEGTLREIGLTKENEKLTLCVYSILRNEWMQLDNDYNRKEQPNND